MTNLTPEEEREVLQKLADMRGTPEVEKYKTPEWARREAVASSRLAGIDTSKMVMPL